MITPINNYQLNTNFQASLKTPKKSPIINKGMKVFNKIKDEFKNLDEESARYLFESTVLLALLTALGITVKNVIERFSALFE